MVVGVAMNWRWALRRQHTMRTNLESQTHSNITQYCWIEAAAIMSETLFFFPIYAGQRSCDLIDGHDIHKKIKLSDAGFSMTTRYTVRVHGDACHHCFKRRCSKLKSTPVFSAVGCFGQLVRQNNGVWEIRKAPPFFNWVLIGRGMFLSQNYCRCRLGNCNSLLINNQLLPKYSTSKALVRR